MVQTALSLSYIQSPIVPPYFFVFSLVWIYLRHYMNLRILYSILTEFRTVGPFTLNWETQQYKCWIAQYITFPLLATLQTLNLFWFFLIMRVAYNIVFNNVKRDVRSDEEEEADDGKGNEDGTGQNMTAQEVSVANRRTEEASQTYEVKPMQQEALHEDPVSKRGQRSSTRQSRPRRWARV